MIRLIDKNNKFKGPTYVILGHDNLCPFCAGTLIPFVTMFGGQCSDCHSRFGVYFYDKGDTAADIERKTGEKVIVVDYKIKPERCFGNKDESLFLMKVYRTEALSRALGEAFRNGA